MQKHIKGKDFIILCVILCLGHNTAVNQNTNVNNIASTRHAMRELLHHLFLRAKSLVDENEMLVIINNLFC